MLRIIVCIICMTLQFYYTFQIVAQSINWTEEVIYTPSLANAHFEYFLDVNADGIEDVVIISRISTAYTDKLIVLINTLNGKFDTKYTYNFPIEAGFKAILDYDKDGDFDIVLQKSSSKEVFLIEQHCFMQFKDPKVLFKLDEFSALSFAHFNADKYIDFFIHSWNKIEVRLSKGDKMYKLPFDIIAEEQEDVLNAVTIDYNNDGIDELILTPEIANDTGSILKILLFEDIASQANNTYNPIILDTLFGGANLYLFDILTIDADNNQKTDIIVSCRSENSNGSDIKIYQNKGGKQFEEKHIYNIDGNILNIYPNNLVFKDLDNDGLKDILFNEQSKGYGYLKNLNGQFLDPIYFKEDVPNFNFDADPKLDLFELKDNQILYKKNFDGFVYQDSCYRLHNEWDTPFFGIKSERLFFNDFDRDGNTDIVVFNQNYNKQLNSMVVFKNDGYGIFDKIEPHLINKQNCIETMNSNVSIEAIADMNNDQELDIIYEQFDGTTNSYASKIALNINNTFSIKNFDSIPDAYLHGRLYSKFVDFDNNNSIDFITELDTLAVLFSNDGNGNFSLNQKIDLLSDNVNQLYFLDMDNNGFTDVATNLVNEENKPLVYYNQGNNHFEGTFLKNDIVDYIVNIDYKDLNNDANIDYYTVLIEEDEIILDFYYNNQSGLFVKDTFSKSVYSPVASLITSYFLYDFNSDTYLDLLVRYEPNNYYLAFNNENINFTALQEFPEINFLHGIYFVDIDNDSDLDIVGRYFKEIKLLRNQTFQNQLMNDFQLEEENTSVVCNVFHLPSIYAHIEMKIYNLQGQLIDQQIFENTNSGPIQFNAVRGLYIAQFKTNTGAIYTQKIIK